MKHLKISKRPSKILLVGISICIFTLVVGGYIWWSIASWGSYEQKYTEKQQSILHNLESVWNMPADTIEQKQAKLAQLTNASTEISKVDSQACSQMVLIGWQRIIQANNEREKTCKETIQSIQELGVSLRPAVEFLQQDEVMAKIMGQAPSKTEVAETDFNDQLGAWRATLDVTKSMPAGNEFGPVKQAAQASIENMVKAWEEIIASHEAKDKARYSKAVQALAAAYDKLEDITKVHTEQFSILVAKFK